MTLSFYSGEYLNRYVSDFELSLHFYDNIFQALGLFRGKIYDTNGVKKATYGNNNLIILSIYNDPTYKGLNPLKPIKNFFIVETHNLVETFYQTAIELGALKLWEPELQKDECYSTCVKDPDGYSIAVKYDSSYKMLFILHKPGKEEILNATIQMQHKMSSFMQQCLISSPHTEPIINNKIDTKYLEEQLACLIYYLPSEWVKQFADTPDRMTYWMHLRGFYMAVSTCWQARLVGDTNDLLLKLLDNRLIDDSHSERVRLRVDRFQALWKIVFYGEAFIRQATIKQGIEYPFTSAVELFFHILRTEADNAFLVCLKPYYTVSKKDINSAILLRKKLKNIIDNNLVGKTIQNPQLDDKDYGKIKALASRLPHNSWLNFSVLVCALKSKTNRLLRDELAAYLKAIELEDKQAATALSRRRSSKISEKVNSFTWQNGKMILASKYGGVYRG